MGMMVTHFSLGSLFSSQGFSTSPFFTLRERKYRAPAPCVETWTSELEKLEPGREIDGEAKGFTALTLRGDCRSILSSP